MTVLRIKKSDNFVCIHKGALENPKLSFKAKGLWAYCMSRKNDWQFHVSHLSKVSKEKEDAVYSAIKELEKEGYIRKVQNNKNGKFEKVDYEVYEESQLKKCLPQPGFPDAGFPDAGNPALVSNDGSVNIEEEIYTEGKAPVPPLPPPSPKQTKRKRVAEVSTELALRVFMTPSQVEALKKRLEGTKITLQTVFDKLSNWKIANEIWGGSDYSSIIKWVIDACAKDMNGKTSQKSPNPPNHSSKLDTANKNRILANGIERKCYKLVQVGLIHVSNDYIEFNLGNRGGDVKVSFDDPGFKDRCAQYLHIFDMDSVQ